MLSSVFVDRPRLAMLHYPPWMPGQEETEVVRLLREFEVRICVYGHLHDLEPGRYPEGERDGIRYHCVSVDLVEFAPRLVVGPQRSDDGPRWWRLLARRPRRECDERSDAAGR